MKRAIAIMGAALAFLLFSAGCERYEVKAQNAPFSIEATAGDVNAGEDLPLTVSLSEGSEDGEFYLSLKVENVTDGSSPAYTVYLGGNSSIEENSALVFSNKKMNLVLRGVPQGRYKVNVCLKRWYHSASAVTYVTVNP